MDAGRAKDAVSDLLVVVMILTRGGGHAFSGNGRRDVGLTRGDWAASYRDKSEQVPGWSAVAQSESVARAAFEVRLNSEAQLSDRHIAFSINGNQPTVAGDSRRKRRAPSGVPTFLTDAKSPGRAGPAL